LAGFFRLAMDGAAFGGERNRQHRSWGFELEQRRSRTRARAPDYEKWHSSVAHFVLRWIGWLARCMFDSMTLRRRR
jgi:hypothetical protein